MATDGSFAKHSAGNSKIKKNVFTLCGPVKMVGFPVATTFYGRNSNASLGPVLALQHFPFKKGAFVVMWVMAPFTTHLK